MPRLSRRRALTRLLALPAVLSASLRANPASAQEGASLAAERPVVAPLDPVAVTARAPGYSGPATIVLFDARKRFAGSAEGRIEGGQGVLAVTPRGAPGPQWAALFLGDKQAAANPAIFTLEARTAIRAGQWHFDAFVPAAERLMAQAVLAYPMEGRTFRGYRSPDSPLIWLRDHVYQLRGARYFDADVRGALDLFRDYQQPDGSFPDFLPRPDVAPLGRRTDVEADVEYLYVLGVYTAWQATGDDGWLRTHLGAMRRALEYTLRSPLRWDAERGLVKRPYTIDTWDFEVGPTTADPATGEPSPRHWIDENTVWSIFHGDNTGMVQALGLLARVEERVGEASLAQLWRDLAAGIIRNLNAVAWNGGFYQHQVPLEPFAIPGVDVKRQLSLSNALALNRGTLTGAQARQILEEYIRRGAEDNARYAAGRPDGAFAGWYSIDPPFPPGAIGLAGRSGENPGDYVNGGIMPLVGGELARGAFANGHEEFGFATLEHYWLRMLSRGRTFLWYRRDGAEGVGSDQTIPTDGWGASAMLCALIEGAAGIEDGGVAYRDVTVSPRWAAAAGVGEAYAVARYAASDGYVAYRWRQSDGAIDLELTGSADRARVRVLLPPGAATGRRSRLTVLLNGAPARHEVETIIKSRYVVLDAQDAVVNVQIRWQG